MPRMNKYLRLIQHELEGIATARKTDATYIERAKKKAKKYLAKYKGEYVRPPKQVKQTV